MNIGIVGAGRIAKAHFERLSKLKDIKIKGVADIIFVRAKEMAEKCNANAYSSFEELLENEKNLDAIFICTPPYSREPENIIKSARRGIHLFIEKPPARTLITGERLQDVFDKTGIVVSVGFLWRYSEFSSKVKEYLKDERCAMIVSRWYHTIPPIAWVRDKERAGGQVVDQSIHLIDLMRYIVGDARSVYSQSSKGLFPEVEDFINDDASVTIINFQNGTVASLASTYSLFPHPEHGARIEFMPKRLRLEGSLDYLKVFTPENMESFKFTDDPMEKEQLTFFEAIEKNDRSKILSPYEDSLKTLKIALSANRSMETGEVINL
ncbi:MAG TPA: Gfo/Idh/MocA family oxidoreductase [bacterium]|nr:Gfo/Idh/MocA family oxidoreductase [bacterium]